MAESKVSNDDIQEAFKKLRAIATNKVCFDCNAKNPTWSSVTYGVFICIDCSAVHRSLGVHLTFVRSTQLDTNWTWTQLRQMQLGGNAAASVFFRQHNCVTTDAQQKYTSRAAQLYREKLLQSATNAMRIHGTELHIEALHNKDEESKKEVDFFDEHSFPESNYTLSEPDRPKPAPLTTPMSSGASLSGKGPSVDLTASVPTTERKSIIGGRKPQAKKTGLGGKKLGLGAQRVQTNFADLEKQAELIDQRKEKEAEEKKKEITVEEEQEQIVSMRLAYQDLSMEQQKQEEKLKKSDPKKAQQVERLGMGFAAKSGFSHSALSDMQTIEQETPVKKTAPKSSYGDEVDDDYLDDLGFPSSRDDHRPHKFHDSFKTSYSSSYSLSSSSFSDDIRSPKYDSSGSSERFGVREPKTSVPSSKSYDYGFVADEKPRKDVPKSAPPIGDDAQKKFGNAKAISSDQFFGQANDNSYERSANLARFEGSTSISSSDYFGDGQGGGSSGSRQYSSNLASSISVPDLEDVRDSVRKGVTKVAGRISSLTNGVLTSIQDRYGY